MTERIHELRIKYEKEIAFLDTKYKEALARIEQNKKKTNGVNYYEHYQRRYAELCNVMGQYYQRILDAERDIHGLDFYAERYLPSASVLPFGKRSVEEMFEYVMLECQNTVRVLSEKHSLKEYATLLKNFCDLYATVRYMDKNSARLLKESGLPDADKAKALEEVEATRRSENAAYEDARKIENRKCYGELLELKRDIEDIYDKASYELLGNVPLGDDGQYRYLLGFNLEKAEESDLSFCEDTLGVSRDKIGKTPVYLEPLTGCCNILINAPGEFLSSRAYGDLVQNIYFSFASRVDKNMLQMGYIDCHRGPSALQTMYVGMDTTDSSSMKRLGGEGIFCYGDVRERNSTKLKECFDKIYNDCNDAVAHYGNVYEYNLDSEKSKVPLKLVFVNFYPIGFAQSYGEQPYDALKMLMKEYVDTGCIFVVCQDINAPVDTDDMRIDAKDCNAVEISLSEGNYTKWKESGKSLGYCEFTVNGRPATLDIAVKGFDGTRYWDKLKDFYSKKKVFSLRDVFRRTDAATNNWSTPPSVFDDGVIEIPLGLKGSEEYCLRYPISTAGHTLVYGGSGAGKSSFLHTLILSLCYKYSSEDVQIYLADFKKTEFSFYVRNQLPHIKYFLLKPGISEICAIFDMIERIRIERNELIEKYGCSDIRDYNKKVKEDNDGTMEKLPMIIFIIDEYQVMDKVTGAPRPIMDKIYKAINTVLSQARSTGISLFLCAQNIDGINSLGRENVKTYILMGAQLGTDRYIREIFLDGDPSMDALREVKQYLAVEKEGRCLIKSSEGKVADKVRFAYAGKEDADKVAYINSIKQLRRQEKISMVLGGSEEPVKVSSFPDYHEVLLKDERKTFSLPLGVGSSSGFSLSMTFDTNEKGDHYGWMVYSESTEKVNNILRNAILAFIYKTAACGYNYKGQVIEQRVIHFATERDHSDVLGSNYAKDMNCIEPAEYHIRQMEINKSLNELCLLIMDLNDELNRRAPKVSNVHFYETKEFPPYLVVFQSLGWLNAGNIDRALKEYYEKETIKEKEEKKIEHDAIVGKPDLSSRENINAFIKEDFETNLATMVKSAERSTEARKKLRGKDIVDMVDNLFREGSKCGIFVVANPESRSRATDVFGSNAADKAVYWNNCVYGSFKEYINEDNKQDENNQQNDNGNANSSSSSMICYVGAGGIKTRMFDYSPGTQNEWWKVFESVVKEK